jgi:hypothetical protein
MLCAFRAAQKMRAKIIIIDDGNGGTSLPLVNGDYASLYLKQLSEKIVIVV